MPAQDVHGASGSTVKPQTRFLPLHLALQSACFHAAAPSQSGSHHVNRKQHSCAQRFYKHLTTLLQHSSLHDPHRAAPPQPATSRSVSDKLMTRNCRQRRWRGARARNQPHLRRRCHAQSHPATRSLFRSDQATSHRGCRRRATRALRSSSRTACRAPTPTATA